MTNNLLFSTNTSTTPTSKTLLQQINLTNQSLNYKLSFININKQNIKSLHYRHTHLDNRPLTQLLQINNPHRKIIQRNNKINYFKPKLKPFTLNNDYIIDSLPSLIYTDFKHLSPYYNFISIEHTHITDRLYEIIHVITRNNTHYNYIV